MATATNSRCAPHACGAWKLTAALLFLRLCLGAHFFSEGTKKLTYDADQKQWSLNPEFTTSTTNLLRGATGPLAPLYHGLVPKFYDWQRLLAVPQRDQPLAPAALAARQQWQHAYQARRREAAVAKQPLPIEFPADAPYRDWANHIVAGFSGQLQAFTELPRVSTKLAAAAAEALAVRHQQLADFLATESATVTEYQHQLWRLEQLEREPGSDAIPYRQTRLDAQRAEAAALGTRLVQEVQGIERGFHQDLRALVADPAQQALRAPLDRVLAAPGARRLVWLNRAAMGLTLGVGICLVLGLGTRWAALAAIGFLVTVMLTQLPWVAGAKSMLFYYQLVECAGLLTLVMASPGRLPGVDRLCRRWGCCQKKPAVETKE